MSPALALPLLALSLAVTLSAARTFARRLDRLGVAFGMPEALLGLLTALVADGPEISSALVALAKGEHSVGVGVVIGSNAFNLAAMIGLSALLTGAVKLRRAALALEGTMGIAATLLAAAVLLGALAPALGVLLLACIGVPYLLALTEPRLLTESGVLARLLPDGPRAGLAAALRAHAEAQTPGGEQVGDDGTEAVGRGTPETDASELAVRETHTREALWMISDVALIIAGSFGMVQAAGALGSRWGISGALIGVLVLGPLTSIPNALTGVRLGLARRGSALVSETLNSNTINLAGGIMVPALLSTLSVSSTSGRVELAWLLAMIAICLLALARPRGADRRAGALLLVLYAGFVVLQLALS
jgi:cation:H+ antiporter